MPTGIGNTAFSITLPDKVIERLMLLKPGGLYGNNRAEISERLIIDMLKTPDVRAEIAEARATSPKAKGGRGRSPK